MKTVAYYPVHYGREWFHWSLRSIVDYVDEILIAYVKQPSYGYRTGMHCPEVEEALREIAKPFNVTWISHESFGWEGQHRDWAVDYCVNSMKADVILAVDCDEVWDADMLQATLNDVIIRGEHKEYRVPMQHFWRSVEWVCRDPLQPVRVIKPSGEGEVYANWGEDYHVHHFGYAQSPLIVNYKWQIHGHQAELRPGWYEDIFMGWPDVKFDVHPTNLDFWTPSAFGKDRIEHLIGDHPYFNMDVIDNRFVIGSHPEEYIAGEVFLP